MTLVPAPFPFSVADAEAVELSFAEGDLVLRFTDWKGKPVSHRFAETLAFRWSARSSVETPRQDSIFEVPDSAWLREEVEAERISSAEAFVHYVLCFNAAKTLEVICRRGGD